MSAFHTRTVSSQLAEASRCPSGLNATLITGPVWPVSGAPRGWPVSAFHTRTVPSALAEASRCPSGLNATPLTQLVWPVSGAPRGWPVSAFHTRTVPSRLAEASRCPSGLNATPLTQLVWPVSGAPRGWPVSAFHSRTVSSPLAEARRCPSGLNATPLTQLVWPVSGVAEGLAGVGVPQPHRVVLAGGGEPVPVGAERHTAHPSVWPVSGSPSGWPVSAFHTRTVWSSPAEASRCPSGLNATPLTASVWPVSGCAEGLAGVGVPQPHGAVVAGGGQPVPVGAERHTAHRVGVAGEDFEGGESFDQGVEHGTRAGPGAIASAARAA